MKQALQLSDLDRRILRAIQSDGAIAQADLATRVGASPASCWRRLRALREAGVLEGTVQLVNAEAVRRGLDVLCQVKMKSHTLEARAVFEAMVRGHEEVMECYSISGEWDYHLRVVVESVPAYNQFLLNAIMSGGVVAACSSHFALERIKYKTAIPV